jgi:integrase
VGAGSGACVPRSLFSAPAGALFEVAVLTGLRRGEITGLRWSDVGLTARKVIVRRNRVTVHGRVVEQNTPKTKAGLRTVALSDFAVATLLAWHLRQAQEAETAAEAWQTEGHVFTMEDGRALDPAYITRLFQKLRKGPGEELPAMSFHGLRHCAASLMLASGADIAVVSKLLGHASISITADVYGHLIATVASDAVNGAASLIASKVAPHNAHTNGREHLMNDRSEGPKVLRLGQINPGSIAQLVRALALQARGQQFESACSHHHHP